MDSLIGRFVTSKAGHDKAKVYVVTGCEGEFIYLCDGRCRTVSNPKKKKVRHVQPIDRTVNQALLVKLEAHEAVSDEEIKYELKLYHQKQDN